jgi:nucleotide-binding universal stress UspA family protein
MSHYRKIVVPVDGSPTSNKALVAALQMARDSGGKVHLVHSIDEFAYFTGFEYYGDVVVAMRRAADEILTAAAEVAQAAGVEYDARLIELPGRRLGDAIADEAAKWGADLIVAGTHGRHGISRALLGSGAEQILRMAPVPVLVIRSAEEAEAA